MSSSRIFDEDVDHSIIRPEGRAFLAGAVLASVSVEAERTFVEVVGPAAGAGTLEEAAAHVEARGMALMDLWADLMVRIGQDREPWVRAAALEAVQAYAGRLGELMAGSAEGDRS